LPFITPPPQGVVHFHQAFTADGSQQA
jgi:hypothetical protein